MDEPPRGQASRVRRRAVIGAAVAAALGAGGWGVWRARRASRQSHAEALAADVYRAIGEGHFGAALGLAKEAREASPGSTPAALAWLHAAGLVLIEGDPDPALGVEAVSDARKLGARGTDLAFITLAAAVTMKNDRFAERLLEQHEKQGVAADIFYHYAAGAALDLACDPRAEERFFLAASGWEGPGALPRVRRARSLVFAARYTEATAELARIAGESPEKTVMTQVVRALEAPEQKRDWVDPFALTDLPRSVRPLAQALTLSPENDQSGIDAALSDVDTPLVAVACADIARLAGDLVAAEKALVVAHEMRPELSVANTKLVEIRLLRGDLSGASSAAAACGETEPLLLVACVSAYEAKKPKELAQTTEDGRSDKGEPWSLADAAQTLLEKGRAGDLAALRKAVKERQVWADILLFDAALAEGDLATARELAARWSDDLPAHAARKKALEERGKAEAPGPAPHSPPGPTKPPDPNKKP